MASPCHLSRFYLISMSKHDMDFVQGQVISFPWHLLRKWFDFYRIRCHCQPNCRQKDMKKPVSHFLQDKKRKRIRQYIVFSMIFWDLCIRFNFKFLNSLTFTEGGSTWKLKFCVLNPIRNCCGWNSRNFTWSPPWPLWREDLGTMAVLNVLGDTMNPC